MRNETRRGAIGGILAAASIGALFGGTSARGDFIVTLSGPTTIGGDDVYVLAAKNDGTLSSGNQLQATDTTIDSASPLVIDLAADVDGDGTPDADIAGQADYFAANPQPSFGTAIGTFIGIASSGNPLNVNSRVASSSLNADFVNANAGVAGAPQADYLSSKGTVDPNFTGGTVTALEIASSFTSGGTLATNNAVHFANIVVPTGTAFTVHGSLGGNTGNPFSFVATSANGALPAVGLLGTVGTLAGSANIRVTNGNNMGGFNPQSVTIPAANQTTGFIAVKGFEAGENEVYALTVTGENSVSQLISDVNTAVGIEDPGATAIAPTADILARFPTADVEVVVPSPAGLTLGQTVDFSWDFDSYTSNNDPPAIAAIGVIPEPTSIALLGLGGATLLARRRRRA
jgi:hypothetical protein